MATKAEILKATHDSFARQALDQGKLVEYGWRAYRIVAVPKDAPTLQIEQAKNAYYHGAQHLFACIMSGLEEGSEPTPNDLRRMDNLNRELEVFQKQEELRFSKPGGSA